ncbi:hypothetical protein J3R83DRAFT_1681 [Lanmaoa asiatica]|nr:hypothetical protein J3R83DRAFT_1681 [Lanmaoa asiatica]
MDPFIVAKHFTEFYYTTFDADRSQLGPLYVRPSSENNAIRVDLTTVQRPKSMLTFEKDQVLGVEAIVEKLTSLPFTKVRHNVSTIDAQPSISSEALIVSVTGYLLVDDEPNPLSFSQVFQLVSEGTTYYVFNDIFRLNVG